MPSVDEKLLAKLVSKYGVDKEPQQTARSRLWGRVVKEYNTITDNNVSRQKIVKKWQNVAYQKKIRAEKLLETLKTTEVEHDAIDPLNSIISKENESNLVKDSSALDGAISSTCLPQRENLWTVCDHVLRNLFLYLVKKYSLEEISHPRQKSELWTKLCQEFHKKINHCVHLRQERFTKKWQNWKAYNKSKNLPHPFQTHKEFLDFDVIKSKLYDLQDMVASDKVFAQRLAREGDNSNDSLRSDTYDLNIDNDADCDSAEDDKPGNIEMAKKNIFSRGAMVEASGSSSSDKKLEREIMLRKLKYEIDRRALLLENSELESNKLKLETELIRLQMQQTTADIRLKQHALSERGISSDEMMTDS